MNAHTKLPRPLWADLHNHNAVGYGKGSIERSYAIARGSLLDVFCFTPHGLWVDTPANDPKMVEYHRTGFGKVRAAWPDIVAKVKAEYEPGRFVTLLGFEWHSSEFGDYHVLFPGNDGEVIGAETLVQLQAFVRERGAIMIPHHVAYRQGWRGLSWDGLNSDVSPLVDVFSEHGCTIEAETPHPMLLHSMGGIDRSQTVIEQFKRGLVAGVVGSTDNHHGHPASYNEGLAGILAGSLTREAVFDAMRRRHTFAVSGDRIGLNLRMGGGMMGDVLPAKTSRTLSWDVDALGAVDSVRIIKNGRVVENILGPQSPNDNESGYVVRISFGWDTMKGLAVTDWRVRVNVSGGRIVDVSSCYAGGDGSVEKVNAVEAVADNEVTFSAFTSRANARPISEVVLRIEGRADTRVRVEAQTQREDKAGGCTVTAALADLLQRDEWAAISDVFSAPRIRLGQAHGWSETRLSGTWTDPHPGADDWYLLRVQQANGQMAWSSPIWCRDRQ